MTSHLAGGLAAFVLLEYALHGPPWTSKTLQPIRLAKIAVQPAEGFIMRSAVLFSSCCLVEVSCFNEVALQRAAGLICVGRLSTVK